MRNYKEILNALRLTTRMQMPPTIIKVWSTTVNPSMVDMLVQQHTFGCELGKIIARGHEVEGMLNSRGKFSHNIICVHNYISSPWLAHSVYTTVITAL